MDNNYYKQYEPIFGVWHITRLIGEGSFGKVFEMEREDFGQVYKAALKVITIPASQSEVRSVMSEGMDEGSVRTYFGGFVKKLVQEFALMSKLKGNSNVVSYENHQVIEHQGGIGWDIFIQMELLTPLDDYIRQKKTISRQEIIQLGIDLCKALELCQKHNIIHRDIKPENIFISENGDFKLGDFGVARTVEKTVSGLSKQGSYPYMAPEVYKGEAYGSTVDLYSLGLVLYRLLNGNRLPFLPLAPVPITYADREKALAKRFGGALLPMPSHAEGRLGEIVLKACGYESKDRYSSPGQMRQELEAILYNKEEGKYIYPDGDEVRQDSIHSSKGDDEPPIQQEEGGTVSDFGKTVSDFSGTASDFGHESEKKCAETLLVVPKWETTGFQFLIEAVVSADAQKALVSGVVKNGSVKRGDCAILLDSNTMWFPVEVGNIWLSGGGVGIYVDRTEPWQSVRLELLYLGDLPKGESVAQYDVLVQPPEEWRVEDILRFSVGFDDRPIRCFTWEGDLLTAFDRIDVSADGGRDFPQGYFDPVSIRLSVRQQKQLRSCLKAIPQDLWSIDTIALQYDLQCPTDYTRHCYFSCELKNGEKFDYLPGGNADPGFTRLCRCLENILPWKETKSGPGFWNRLFGQKS